MLYTEFNKRPRKFLLLLLLINSKCLFPSSPPPSLLAFLPSLGLFFAKEETSKTGLLSAAQAISYLWLISADWHLSSLMPIVKTSVHYT
jgi:hypothetical protein